MPRFAGAQSVDSVVPDSTRVSSPLIQASGSARVTSFGSWTPLIADPSGTPPPVPLSDEARTGVGVRNTSVIFDPLRGHIVQFGGLHGSLLTNQARYAEFLSAVWTDVPAGETTPPVRMLHSAIYDPVRDRMIVVGGWDGHAYLNDVWALSLADPMHWTQLDPGGDAFPARGGASVIYDPVGDRIIVFGGSHDPASRANVLGDLWSLSLAGSPTWTQLLPVGPVPPARVSAASMYDPVGRKMYVVDGYNGAGLSDCWSLDLAGTPVWNEITPTGPVPFGLDGAVACFDATHRRMILDGGIQGGGVHGLHDEIWALDLASPTAWQLLGHGPIPLYQHAVTVGADGTRGYLVGGLTLFPHDTAPIENDMVWSIVLDWMPPQPPPPPSPYRGPGVISYASAFDAGTGKVTLFGGYDGTLFRGEVWQFSNSSPAGWTQLPDLVPRPAPRDGCRMVYDRVRHRLVIFGGRTFDGQLPQYPSDTWTLSLEGTPTWAQIATIGSPPGRADYGMAYDRAADRVVLFGGRDETTTYGDTWQLSLTDPPTWTQAVAPAVPASPGTAPVPRWSHTLTYVPPLGGSVLFGGRFDTSDQSDTWLLTLGASPHWTFLTPSTAAPTDHAGHGADYDAAMGALVVFGGLEGAGQMLSNSTWLLPLSAGLGIWEQLVPGDGIAPAPRMDCDVVYDEWRGVSVEHGGYLGSITNPARDTWSLLLSGVVATQLSLVSAEFSSGAVSLDWYTSDHGVASMLYRQRGIGPWSALTSLNADGTGHIRYRDADVLPGVTYGYRLGVSESGAESFYGATSIAIPSGVSLAVRSVRMRGSVVSMALSVPLAGDVAVEMLDVGGRRVANTRAQAMAAGNLEVSLNAPGLASGLYFVRVRAGGQSAQGKAVLFR